MDDNKKKALAAALGQIERQFGKGAVMRMGDQDRQAIPAISTGSLGLDIALGIGGLPKGRIVEIYGPESSGKTTLTLQVIAEMQKQGGTCAFVDAEHALDSQYAQKLGVNLQDLLISQPDTGEQALEVVDSLVRSGAVDLVVVDSVAALTPKAELEGEIVEIEIEAADGRRKRSFARPDVVDQAALAPEPPVRLRILSPFDPALRDRDRTEFLFGFHYRIEVFVPEPQRKFGYYVFPVLEGDRLIGRIDAKAHRDANVLRVKAFWPEAGIKLSAGRQSKLEAELARLAAFSGCDRIEFLPGWQRETLA